MGNWQVRLSQQAQDDLISFLDEVDLPLCIYDEVVEEVNRLASLDDPREDANVKFLNGELRGLFRLAIYKFGLRVVFELYYDAVDRLRITPHTKLINLNVSRVIEIKMVAHRSHVYELMEKVLNG